ncbi:Olfactory receptor 4K5 [Lemmus lemmus]
MYFLLGNLSFLDIWIADFLSEHKTISFSGCIAQIFFIHLFTGGEMVLLVSMAYDRYVAICKPLRYMIIMNRSVCTALVIISWAVGLVHTLSQLSFTVNLAFCGPNEVDSFFCDLPRIVKLACIDSYITEILIVVNSGILSLSTFSLLVSSYAIIFVTVWLLKSSAAMANTFSTLAAHIMVVALFSTLAAHIMVVVLFSTLAAHIMVVVLFSTLAAHIMVVVLFSTLAAHIMVVVLFSTLAAHIMVVVLFSTLAAHIMVVVLFSMLAAHIMVVVLFSTLAAHIMVVVLFSTLAAHIMVVVLFSTLAAHIMVVVLFSTLAAHIMVVVLFSTLAAHIMVVVLFSTLAAHIMVVVLFSTLAAHIVVVALFFGPCIFIYVWPFTTYPVDKILAIFYTVFTPILNPIIYTLRNRDMKTVMGKIAARYFRPPKISDMPLVARICFH